LYTFVIARWLLLGITLSLLTLAAALAAEPAGRVLFVAGAPTATTPQGITRTLRQGDAIEEGDLLMTGEGRLQVVFKDEAMLALQPGSRFQVKRYRYKAKGDDSDSVILRLIHGGLRTISGFVGKRNHSDYQMDGSVAYIGIRGTEYGLELTDKLIGSVTEGAIEVCNAGGCLHVPTGRAFLVPSATDRPVLTERRVFLPPPPAIAHHAGQDADPESPAGTSVDGGSAASQGQSEGDDDQAEGTQSQGERRQGGLARVLGRKKSNRPGDRGSPTLAIGETIGDATQPLGTGVSQLTSSGTLLLQTTSQSALQLLSGPSAGSTGTTSLAEPVSASSVLSAPSTGTLTSSVTETLSPVLDALPALTLSSPTTGGSTTLDLGATTTGLVEQLGTSILNLPGGLLGGLRN
jgi:hypothetical protein